MLTIGRFDKTFGNLLRRSVTWALDLGRWTILLHQAHKKAEIDRFTDYRIGVDIVDKPAGSHDHNGQRLQSGIALLARAEFPTTHYGHHQIENNQRRL